MNNYTPRTGSLADKVIAQLQLAGGPITCGQITALFGTTANNISNMLKAAVTHGALKKCNGEGEQGYDLGDGQPAQPKATASAMAPAQPKAKKARAARVDTAAELQPTPNPATQLTLTRWSDGDVFVQDFEICDGGQLRLTLAQQQQLVNFLCTPAITVPGYHSF